MKLAICGSLNFTYEIDELRKKLEALNFEVIIPPTAQRILKGEFTLDEIKLKKENGNFSQLVIENDAIKIYFNIIKDCDCVLIVNYTKNNIINYIGGNAFLEMGFAHVLNKKIYLLNDIPEMIYSDEIKAMQPVILNGDLSKIK
ncbi:MAG TPA: hypothetical protein PKL13_04530 [bacterium]|nr:hypothetical protein [bacterium]